MINATRLNLTRSGDMMRRERGHTLPAIGDNTHLVVDVRHMVEDRPWKRASSDEHREPFGPIQTGKVEF